MIAKAEGREYHPPSEAAETTPAEGPKPRPTSKKVSYLRLNHASSPFGSSLVLGRETPRWK